MKNLSILTIAVTALFIVTWVHRNSPAQSASLHPDSRVSPGSKGARNGNSQARNKRGIQLAQADAAADPKANDSRDSKPADSKPADAKPDDAKGTDAKPGDAPADAEKSAEEKSNPKCLEVLRNARERLAAVKSIKANITEKVAILDHSFTAKGSYLQGTNLQSRLEFSLELGGNKGSLLEVCDGQILWTRHDIGDQPQITRRDVKEILKAAEQSQRIAQDVLVAAMGLGGLPALLAAFEREIEFNGIAEEKIDEHPVTVIEGKWNKMFRDRFLAFTGSNQPASGLPLFVPDSIRVYFDKATDFPRRILYLKQIPGRKVSRPMLTIDFTNVKLNGPVRDEDFAFIPPASPLATDVTESFLQRLSGPPAQQQSAPTGFGGAPQPGDAPQPVAPTQPGAATQPTAPGGPGFGSGPQVPTARPKQP